MGRNVAEAASGSSEIAGNVGSASAQARSAQQGAEAVVTAAADLGKNAAELQALVTQFRY